MGEKKKRVENICKKCFLRYLLWTAYFGKRKEKAMTAKVKPQKNLILFN